MTKKEYQETEIVWRTYKIKYTALLKLNKKELIEDSRLEGEEIIIDTSEDK